MLEKLSEEAKRQFESKLWIGRMVGVATLDGKIINPQLIMVIAVGVVEQTMHIHGIIENWPNLAYFCNSIVIYCLIFQIFTRFVSKIVHDDDKNFLALLKTIMDFYDREEQNSEHRLVLKKHLQMSDMLLNGYLTVCFLMFCVPNPTAWIVSWYTGENILFTPIYLPYIDLQTFSGYIISSAILAFLTMIVFAGLMIAELLFIYFIYQCVPMADIFCLNFKKLGVDLMRVKYKEIIVEMQQSTSRKDFLCNQLEELKQEDVEKRLIVIIKEFNTYNRYVRSIVEFMKYTTFLALSQNAMAMAMAIIITRSYSSAIGIVIFIFLSFQVLMPCTQGSLITYQKEKILNELYEFPWYELSNSKQKIFLQFIHLVQNSNELQIPLIGELKMEVFTDVINGAYSYFVYLRNFGF